MKQKNTGLIFISPDHNLCRAFFLTQSNVFPSDLSQRPNSHPPNSKPTIFLTVHPSVIYHRKAGVSGFKMSYVPKYMAEPILRNRLKHFYLKFSLNFERNLRCVLVCVSKIEKLIIFSAHFVLHIVTGCSPTNNHFKKEFEKTTEVSRKIEPAQSCLSVLFSYWGRNLPETKYFMECMFDCNVSE